MGSGFYKVVLARIEALRYLADGLAMLRVNLNERCPFDRHCAVRFVNVLIGR